VYDRPAVSSDPLLHRAIRAVARGTEPESTLDELLDLALDMSHGSSAAALLWDADRQALAVAGSKGFAEDSIPLIEASAANASDPIHRAAHDRVRVLDELTPGADPGGMRVSAWPIVVASSGVEEPIGALAIHEDQSASGGSPDIANGVQAIADLIAITVDRTRLATEGAERADWIERVGNSDALTGLANARTLARVIELEIARAARQASELCVAIFDVDGLAGINDQAGRGVGDDVLREVAAVAAESVRFVDTMARWGADEFMLVAPGATGTTVVKRIVESVATRPPIGGQRVTVSAGLARFPGDGTTGEALIEAATAALGAAKAVGPGTLAEAVPAASASS
jgi:diguanylate cyclase (GGDEF)-like protein